MGEVGERKKGREGGKDTCIEREREEERRRRREKTISKGKG